MLRFVWLQFCPSAVTVVAVAGVVVDGVVDVAIDALVVFDGAGAVDVVAVVVVVVVNALIVAIVTNFV